MNKTYAQEFMIIGDSKEVETATASLLKHKSGKRKKEPGQEFEVKTEVYASHHCKEMRRTHVRLAPPIDGYLITGERIEKLVNALPDIEVWNFRVLTGINPGKFTLLDLHYRGAWLHLGQELPHRSWSGERAALLDFLRSRVPDRNYRPGMIQSMDDGLVDMNLVTPSGLNQAMMSIMLSHKNSLHAIGNNPAFPVNDTSAGAIMDYLGKFDPDILLKTDATGATIFDFHARFYPDDEIVAEQLFDWCGVTGAWDAFIARPRQDIQLALNRWCAAGNTLMVERMLKHDPLLSTGTDGFGEAPLESMAARSTSFKDTNWKKIEHTLKLLHQHGGMDDVARQIPALLNRALQYEGGEDILPAALDGALNFFKSLIMAADNQRALIDDAVLDTLVATAKSREMDGDGLGGFFQSVKAANLLGRIQRQHAPAL